MAATCQFSTWLCETAGATTQSWSSAVLGKFISSRVSHTCEGRMPIIAAPMSVYSPHSKGKLSTTAADDSSAPVMLGQEAAEPSLTLAWAKYSSESSDVD